MKPVPTHEHITNFTFIIKYKLNHSIFQSISNLDTINDKWDLENTLVGGPCSFTTSLTNTIFRLCNQDDKHETDIFTLLSGDTLPLQYVTCN